MNEQEFFLFLLSATKEAFSGSNIKQKQDELKQKWNYSVCATPILKGKGVICGLNWGGSNVDPQPNYPDDKDIEGYPFIKGSLPLLKSYFGVESIYAVNYTNICFFRSPNIEYLTSEDWKLAVPLFKKYIEYVDPAWILLLGSTGIQYLKDSGAFPTNPEQLSVPDAKTSVFGYCGKLFDRFQFACVPHPGAHISSGARERIWKAVTSKLGHNSDF